MWTIFIQNVSDKLQRTTVKWVKQDIKPWEIVEVTRIEWLTVHKNYWDIFHLVNKTIKKEKIWNM